MRRLAPVMPRPINCSRRLTVNAVRMVLVSGQEQHRRIEILVHLVERLDQMIQVFVKDAIFRVACQEDPVSGQEQRVLGLIRTPKTMFQRDSKTAQTSEVIHMYLAPDTLPFKHFQCYPLLTHNRLHLRLFIVTQRRDWFGIPLLSFRTQEKRNMEPDKAR